ncbi:MAG: hypothetical protein Q8O82_06200 [Pseudorhodobacter sp.]|nr:hypothetical protein [Pseudorhodobacter sp.]
MTDRKNGGTSGAGMEQPMSAAARARRWRQRQRHGLAVWHVEVADHRLAEALIESGLVDPDSTDPADYARAAGVLLNQFAENFSVTRYADWLRKQDKVKP